MFIIRNLHLMTKWVFHAYLKLWCFNTLIPWFCADVSYIRKHCLSLMLNHIRHNHTSFILRSCSFRTCSKHVFALIFKRRSWAGRNPSQVSSPRPGNSEWTLFIFGTKCICSIHCVCLEEEHPNCFKWKSCSHSHPCLCFKNQISVSYTGVVKYQNGLRYK